MPLLAIIKTAGIEEWGKMIAHYFSTAFVQVGCMTFQEFNKLSQDDQEFTMWFSGVLVARRFDRLYRYLLFQVDAFYVELVYPATYTVIQQFKPFEDTALLEPYLSEVDIDALT